MTINVAGWKVFAKTNDAATAKYDKDKDDKYDTTIINGTTTGEDIGFATTLNTKKETGKNETYHPGGEHERSHPGDRVPCGDRPARPQNRQHPE